MQTLLFVTGLKLRAARPIIPVIFISFRGGWRNGGQAPFWQMLSSWRCHPDLDSVKLEANSAIYFESYIVACVSFVFRLCNTFD